MTDPALLGLLASDANRLVEIVFLIDLDHDPGNMD